jgi:predicted enzyme related to lactoylglutathione lyase
VDSEIELIIGPEIPVQRAQPTIRVPQASAARGGTGLGAGLPVADVARSLRFYRDLLGFTVTYATPDSAVVESDGLRLLLDRVDDPAGRMPRSGAASVEVTDIQVAYRSLAAFGAVVTEPPAPAGQGLWRARLQDPDGHEVELLEFRGVSSSSSEEGRPAPA